MYKVELFVQEQLIASGEFEIVDSRIPREGLFLDLREGLPWNTWQPSIDEENALLALAGLMESNPDLASAAASFPWVQETPAEEGLWSLQALETLAREDVDLAKRVIGFSWLADDVTKDEWLALRTLTLAAMQDAAFANSLANFPWLSDEITEDARWAVGYLFDISRRDRDMARSVLSFLWLSDDLTEDERWALYALQDIAAEHPSLAGTLLSLPWLSDDLTEDEKWALRYLRDIAAEHPSMAGTLLSFLWLSDDLTEDERWALHALRDIAAEHPSLAGTLLSLPWLSDQLTEHEGLMVRDFRKLARRDSQITQQIAEMPFLKTFEPADAFAIKALNRLVDLGNEEDSQKASEHFHRVMEHPAITDGITDKETTIIATLAGVSKHNPALVETLLDPAQVTLEERSIELPLAGEVHITIIRTRPGTERTMDLLEKAVRNIEEFMGVPFPNRHVIYLFEDAVPQSFLGANFQTHIASRAKVDEDSYSAESALQVFVHETSHFYWHGKPSWMAEGAATFIEPTTTGMPVVPEGNPCAYAGNIAELESLDPDEGTPEFLCNYSLGERLFHDLYRSLDETAFRQGFRNLYLLLSLDDDPGDECEGVKLDICHVDAAFSNDVTAEAAAIVDKVLARWYHGSEPYDISRQDTSPVDPSLPSDVQGKLTRAYIALDKDRREETETDSFSASEVMGKVYLYLHFSYPRIQEDREFPFTVVEYHGDGFTYNVQHRATTFETGWTQSWQRFSTGPREERRWAPGRYWTYIYHDGRKIAEVEYVVTP